MNTEVATQNEKIQNEVTDSNKSTEGINIVNANIKRIIIGLNEIGNLDIGDFDTNLNISKNIASLNIAEKAYIKTHNSLLNKHVKRNEAGEFMSENNFYIFLSDKDKAEYKVAVDKLNETEVTEPIYKIKTSVLKNVKGLKAISMAKCNELIEDDIK
jgi:hypothetical protein